METEARLRIGRGDRSCYSPILCHIDSFARDMTDAALDEISIKEWRDIIKNSNRAMRLSSVGSWWPVSIGDLAGEEKSSLYCVRRCRCCEVCPLL
jgi:hypothetical protein